MGIRILRRDRDFSDDRVKWAGPLGPHGVGVPVILLCRMKNTEEVPDECRGPDGLPGGQQEGHVAPGNSHLPAHLRPWGSEPWRSQAQVLHEIHSPSLLAWTHGPSPHTFPGNGRCSLDSGLNTSSPQQHTDFTEPRSPSQPRSWPGRQVTSGPRRRLFASGARSPGPGQGLRDGPGSSYGSI